MMNLAYFGRALTRGLTGYYTGKYNADERDYKRQQDELEMKRLLDAEAERTRQFNAELKLRQAVEGRNALDFEREGRERKWGALPASVSPWASKLLPPGVDVPMNKLGVAIDLYKLQQEVAGNAYLDKIIGDVMPEYRDKPYGKMTFRQAKALGFDVDRLLFPTAEKGGADGNVNPYAPSIPANVNPYTGSGVPPSIPGDTPGMFMPGAPSPGTAPVPVKSSGHR
jgi:hypothetical protein